MGLEPRPDLQKEMLPNRPAALHWLPVEPGEHKPLREVRADNRWMWEDH